MPPRKPSRPPPKAAAFNAQAFLDSSRVTKTIVDYGRGESIFTQGDNCDAVMYIQSGGVKLSVLSKTGREAVVAMLEPGDFFGEGCLAGQPLRMGTATAITPSAILRVGKEKMVGLLHRQHAMSDRFGELLRLRQFFDRRFRHFHGQHGALRTEVAGRDGTDVVLAAGWSGLPHCTTAGPKLTEVTFLRPAPKMVRSVPPAVAGGL